MNTTVNVSGMTCGHCASSVTEELSEIPGVTSVDVDLHAGGTSPVSITSERELKAVTAGVGGRNVRDVDRRVRNK